MSRLVPSIFSTPSSIYADDRDFVSTVTQLVKGVLFRWGRGRMQRHAVYACRVCERVQLISLQYHFYGYSMNVCSIMRSVGCDILSRTIVENRLIVFYLSMAHTGTCLCLDSDPSSITNPRSQRSSRIHFLVDWHPLHNKKKPPIFLTTLTKRIKSTKH